MADKGSPGTGLPASVLERQGELPGAQPGLNRGGRPVAWLRTVMAGQVLVFSDLTLPPTAPPLAAATFRLHQPAATAELVGIGVLSTCAGRAWPVGSLPARSSCCRRRASSGHRLAGAGRRG